MPAYRLLYRESLQSPLFPRLVSLVRSCTSRLQFALALRLITCLSWFERDLYSLRSSSSCHAVYLRLARRTPASSVAASGDQSGLARGDDLAFGQCFGRLVQTAVCSAFRGLGKLSYLLPFINSSRPTASSLLITYLVLFARGISERRASDSLIGI